MAQDSAGGDSDAPIYVLDSDETESEDANSGGFVNAAPLGSLGTTTIDSSAIGTFSGFRSIGTLDTTLGSSGVTADPSTLISRRFVDGGLVPPTPELIVRDNIGVNGAVDVNNTLPSVVQRFVRRNSDGGVFFNCTGTIINLRTVLTAAHCVNNFSSEVYGADGGSARTMLVATGVNSSTRLFATLNTGANYAQGGVAESSDVIIHPSSDTSGLDLPFPWADVALIALAEPITDVPALPIFLTPLDRLAHVILTGYGTNGTGNNGVTNTGNRFLRRIGENMLGAIASQADFIDNVFSSFAPSVFNLGQNSQPLYFLDFDNPDRTDDQKNAWVFSGTNISCTGFDAVKAIDFFDGDALPREAGTAHGDSGSPIIVDQLYGFPIVAGVLSGGYDFFGTNNRFGDVSFYNPLYPFFEFISENTPYKYVSTTGGNGYWSDPEYWTQDLDPGFFVDDGTGKLVNGVPAGNEPGVYATGPKVGSILGNDI